MLPLLPLTQATAPSSVHSDDVLIRARPWDGDLVSHDSGHAVGAGGAGGGASAPTAAIRAFRVATAPSRPVRSTGSFPATCALSASSSRATAPVSPWRVARAVQDGLHVDVEVVLLGHEHIQFQVGRPDGGGDLVKGDGHDRVFGAVRARPGCGRGGWGGGVVGRAVRCEVRRTVTVTAAGGGYAGDGDDPPIRVLGELNNGAVDGMPSGIERQRLGSRRACVLIRVFGGGGLGDVQRAAADHGARVVVDPGGQHPAFGRSAQVAR